MSGKSQYVLITPITPVIHIETFLGRETYSSGNGDKYHFYLVKDEMYHIYGKAIIEPTYFNRVYEDIIKLYT